MKYIIKSKATNLRTSNLQIARSVTNNIKRDEFNKRRHGFNVSCKDRDAIFNIKAQLYRALRNKTNIDTSDFYNHLHDDLYNQIHYWKKEEVYFIVENVSATLKFLVNSKVLFRHSKDSIRVKRSAIRAKNLKNLPRKIVLWLAEIGYLDTKDLDLYAVKANVIK